jgi:hypothetical protein
MYPDYTEPENMPSSVLFSFIVLILVSFIELLRCDK